MFFKNWTTFIRNGSQGRQNDGDGIETARHLALLSSISGLVLLCGLSAAHAQAVIDGGQIITVPGDHASPWNVGGNLTVGDTGAGELIVENGGVVSSGFGFIANEVGSSGIVTITGAGSQWNMTSSLVVGSRDTGTLIIENGGVTSSTYGYIGSQPNSSGSVIVTGIGSQWNMSTELGVGYGGTGTLTIANGGVVTNTIGYIGYSPDASGHVTVTGNGSQWNMSQDLVVGLSGIGTLTISSGGFVSTNSFGVIGADPAPDSHGALTVTGIGSLLRTSNGLEVGEAGNGTLTVSDSGVIASVYGIIGDFSGSHGTALVTGAGSQWNNSIDLYVGFAGSGELTIADGGVVSNPVGYIGRASGSIGIVTVTGAGSLWNNRYDLLVGSAGSGELTISKGGAVSAVEVFVASGSSSTGTLNIGSAAGEAPTGPGTVTAERIEFGPGAGKLVFNHTSSAFVFDATINDGADNAVGSGTGLVGSGLIEALAGRTILNTDHGDFTGTLQASGSGILQINGDVHRASASVLAGGRLEGNGIVGNTANAGIIAPGASIGVLTIAGNYAGNNGTLHIETVLGGDASPSDRLVITGDASGSTNVVVTNLGGSGAQTFDGIRIIEVGGISPGNAFTLKGDYVTPDGQQAVIGGAYAYTLRHNSETNPSDGDWYLTSEIIVMNPDTGQPEEDPRYQPGIPLYEQYPQVLAALNTVPTLQQRVGNRGWVNNNAVAAAPGNTPGNYGMWGRIEGTRTASDPARSTIHAHRDADLWKLQTGFDFGLHQGADGSQLIGGVNVSHGTALAEIASPYGRGKVDTTGTGIGATLTWYGSHGFYVDGQAQVTWFDTDITSTTEGRKLIKGNNGHGYVLSAETGNRYQLGNGFSVTPQVQLVYSRVDFDSFSDPFDAHVSLNDGDSLRGRFGVSLDHEAGWVASDGSRSRSHIYGVANLYNEFLDGAKVNVSGVRFSTRDERVWAGIGIGGTYEWANGAYAFYGNANLAGSVEHMSDNYAFGGTLGFRARW